MNRPLGIVALLYGCGVLLGDHWQPPVLVLFSFSLAIALATILLPRRQEILLWPLIVLAGWTGMVWRTAVLSPQDLRVVAGNLPRLATIRGVLVGAPTATRVRAMREAGPERWHTSARVDVTHVLLETDWLPAQGRVAVLSKGVLDPEFHSGQPVEISGVLAQPDGPIADGLFDYGTYLRRQGIYFQCRATSPSDWRLAGPIIPLPWSDRFRAWGMDVLARGLPVKDATLELEYALALGNKAALTEDVAAPFVRAATYHIFAVDGLRMGILFAIAFGVTRVLHVGRAACGLLLVPLIWCYTGLTGWPASAIRASVMLTVVVGGWSLKRPSDLVNSLFGAALAILVADPQQLFQAGFQLSFLVVLSMVLILAPMHAVMERYLNRDVLLPDELRPRWRRMGRVPLRYVLELTLTSFAAWAGSIPLVAFYFHILTPVSTIANVVAVPLCALELVCNSLSFLLAPWAGALAEIYNHAGWLLMECIRVSSRWFADLPLAYAYVPAPDWFTIGLYYAWLMAIATGWLWKQPRRAWKCIGLVVLSLAWCGRWAHDHAVARLTILPVNGGSALFYDAPGTARDMLVDCGNSGGAVSITTPFLRAQGVNRLAWVVLTHGDRSQIGGIGTLRTDVRVGQVAVGAVRSRSPVYREICDWVRNHPDSGREVRDGDQVGDWEVLHPAGGELSRQSDDQAIVLYGTIGGVRVLLLSELGLAGQKALLDSHPGLRAEIIVAGVPRQTEPLCEELLASTQPQLVVVTDSGASTGRRLAPTVLARLAQSGAKVLRLSETGAVAIRLGSSGWEAVGMRGQCCASGLRK